MYKKIEKDQQSFEEFQMPFGEKLSEHNRWVKTAKLIPWELVEELYAAAFKDDCTDGRPPIPARIAFGAIYIKEQENLTDERTVECIAENPYIGCVYSLLEFPYTDTVTPSPPESDGLLFPAVKLISRL